MRRPPGARGLVERFCGQRLGGTADEFFLRPAEELLGVVVAGDQPSLEVREQYGHAQPVEGLDVERRQLFDQCASATTPNDADTSGYRGGRQTLMEYRQLGGSDLTVSEISL